MADVYRKVERALHALEPFTCNEWRFECAHQMALGAGLGPEERHAFCTDARAICWKEFFENYVKEVRRSLLREDDLSLPRARSQLKR